MTWNGQYSQMTTELAQAPVYCVIICEDRTQLGANIGLAPTTINGAAGDSMTLRGRVGSTPIMVYDSDGFEFFRGEYNTGTNDFALEEYASHGTVERTFTRNKCNIAVPWLCFSTESVSTLFETGMMFPYGGGQELDLIEGSTRTNPIAVRVLDTDARITKEMRSRSVIGKWGIVLAGYRGLPFSKFVMLHAGPVTRFKIIGGAAYEFEIDTIMVKLKRKLFADVQNFNTTLSGNMTNSQTTIPLTDNSGVYDSIPAQHGENPLFGSDSLNTWRSAMYFKVGNEYMMHAGGISPQDVFRGKLGSTAVTHSSGDPVDMIFIVEGNPINILLGAMLTRDPGYELLSRYITGQILSDQYYDWGFTVDPDHGALGLHLEVGDINVEQFEEIRDQYYPRYFGRIAFSRETDMESKLRESILKPMGLNLYVDRAGKLSLAILRPPLAPVPAVLDETNVCGVPEIEFTNEEIVNEVTVEYDHDYVTDDSTTTVQVIDATSQSLYDRAGDLTITPTWMRPDLNGDDLAPRLAKKKMRHHREPNPNIPLSVLFTAIGTDLSSVVNFSLDSLPDPQGGRIGFNKTALVVARNPEWDKGTLGLDVIDTAYLGHRYGLIAPSGTPDYTAASDEEKNVYAFAADATGHLSNGDQAYEIM